MLPVMVASGFAGRLRALLVSRLGTTAGRAWAVRALSALSFCMARDGISALQQWQALGLIGAGKQFSAASALLASMPVLWSLRRQKAAAAVCCDR